VSEKTTGAPARAPITTLSPPSNSVSCDSSATGDVLGVGAEFGDFDDQPTADVNPKLEAALDAHRRGFDVIRLHYVKPDGACSCWKGVRCPEKNRGKHPNMGMGWETQPPLSAPDIYAMWEEQPDGNVGIRCGFWSNNLVVIDEDRAGALEEVAAQVGEVILGSYTVRSGSGNRHLYLSLPPGVQMGNSDAALPQGVNVRCQGGQVVAPGSVTYVGSYTIEKDMPVLEAPAALIELLTQTTTVDGEVRLHQVEPADLNPIQQTYLKRRRR
jgi:hypothetical protein